MSSPYWYIKTWKEDEQRSQNEGCPTEWTRVNRLTYSMPRWELKSTVILTPILILVAEMFRLVVQLIVQHGNTVVIDFPP